MKNIKEINISLTHKQLDLNCNQQADLEKSMLSNNVVLNCDPLELEDNKKEGFKLESEVLDTQVRELTLSYDELESLEIELRLDEENLLNSISSNNEIIDNLTIEIYNLENEIKELTENNQVISRKVVSLSTQVDELKQKKNSVEQKLNRETESLDSKKYILKSNKKLVRWLDKEDQVMREKLTKLRKEKERIHTSITSYEKRADEKRSEGLKCKKEIALYEFELLELKNMLNHLEQERLVLKSEQDEYTRALSLIVKDREDLQSAISEIEQENILLEDRILNRENELNLQKKENEKLDSNLSELDKKYQMLCSKYHLIIDKQRSIQKDVSKSNHLYRLLEKRYDGERKKINIEEMKNVKLKSLVDKTRGAVEKSSSVVNKLIDRCNSLTLENDIMSKECAEMNRAVVTKRKEAKELRSFVSINELRREELIAKNAKIEDELTELIEYIAKKNSNEDLVSLEEKNRRLRGELETKQQELSKLINKSDTKRVRKITRVLPRL